MTNRESSETRPGRFGLLFLLAVAVFVIGALALVLLRSRTPSAASLALDRKLAQLQKEGAPLTAADIGKAIPDPDSEHDARALLQPAFAWRPTGRPSTNIPIVSGASMPKRSERISLEAMRDMAAYLTNSDAVLSAMPAQFERVWFSMGWTNGFTNVPPIPYVQVRQVAQTLALKSFYEAERQDSQKATDTLRAGFGLAGTLNGDSLVSTMIRVAVAGLMCEASEQALNRSKLTDAQLLSIQQSINPALADDFTHAYMVERYMATTALDPIRAAYDKGGSEKARLTLWSWFQWVRGNRKPVYRDEDYLLYLNILDERRATQSLPAFERLQRSEQLDAKYKTNIFSTMAEIMGTHWTKATRAAVEVRAKLETAKTALAVERYRLAPNDELPDSLFALVPKYLPAVPRDPLDNQPLRFKKLPRGYTVYSIGADGVDNGGVERTSQTATNHYDVTFTVER
jgi:hypothetical protein